MLGLEPSPSIDDDSTKTYSVLNPVLDTFFISNTSFTANPLAFATDIVVSVAPTFEPVIAVEFATHN